MDQKIYVVENDGVLTLERNGRPLLCPVQTRVLTPGPVGGLSVNCAVCSSDCVMFSYSTQGMPDGKGEVLTCKKSYVCEFKNGKKSVILGSMEINPGKKAL